MANIRYKFPVRSDIEYIAKHMRANDVAEVKAYGLSPYQGLKYSVDNSDECYLALVDGEPSMIFGITLPTFGEPEIWALGTDKLFTIPRDMLREGRNWVRYFLSKAPLYYNYIGAENKFSMNWLKHLNFNIFEPEPRGLHGEIFRRIEIRRKEN